MTNLERVMTGETEEHQRQIAGWMEVMTPAARDLCHRCPPGMIVHAGDDQYRVIGYTETTNHEHAHLLVVKVGDEPTKENLISVCPEKMVVYKHRELN